MSWQSSLTINFVNVQFRSLQICLLIRLQVIGVSFRVFLDDGFFLINSFIACMDNSFVPSLDTVYVKCGDGSTTLALAKEIAAMWFKMPHFC
jgi:hypothetical protein